MGGDGTMAQVIKNLRTSPIIDKYISNVSFAALPYGTGNDTGQVFGWGGMKYSSLNEV